MIELKGTPKHPGIAIATAAVLDFMQGPSSLPYSILQRAASALKRDLAPADQPEVVLVTEQLALGATVKIPGLQKAAVIAESTDDVPGIPINFPCVVGVSEASQRIPNEAIVIVDGSTGDVIAEPDVQTLIYYQNEIEERKKIARLELQSFHEPAQTTDGRTITTAARVRNLEDLQTALTYGADSLVAEVSLFDPDCNELLETIMGAAGTKKVTLIPDQVFAPFLDFVVSLSVPGQLTIAFPGESFIEQKRLMELVIADFPPINLAVVARTSSDMLTAKSYKAEVLLVRSRKEITGAVKKWISEEEPGRLTVSLGDSLDMLPTVIKAGALAVETVPNLLAQAKNMIRSLPDS